MRSSGRSQASLVWSFCALSIVFVGGCPSPCATDDTSVSISFTHVPPFGSFENLQGTTTGATPWAHRVVVYIRVNGMWWVKPTEAHALTPIGWSGRWEADITTGGLDHEATEVRAFIVCADFDAQLNTLPADTSILASATIERSPTLTIKDAGTIGERSVLRGTVDGIAPDAFRIAAYIQVDGDWWVKPSAMNPLTTIAANGTWSVDISSVTTDLEATRVWAGLVREDLAPMERERPGLSDVLDVACFSRILTGRDRAVSCEVEDMFEFAEDQLDAAGNDPVVGGLPASFAIVGTSGLPEDFLNYALDRAFAYDASTILIAMAMLTPDRREAYVRQIADAFVFAIENDPAGDGRVRNEYFSNDIRAPEPNRERPSIRNGETHVGNAAWVILALCHAYDATADARYLTAAETLGNWVESEMRADDAMGGYFGGALFPQGTTEHTDANLVRVGWRSVEHNTDLIVAFQSLANLTSNTVWSERAAHARIFVESVSLYDCSEGYWYVGTTVGMEINYWPIAEDTATWPWLAGVRPCGEAPLAWALSELRTVTNGFDGIRFSTTGEGVVTESTAHLALALLLAGDNKPADELLRALLRIQSDAPNTDGRGLVAAPAPGNGVESGCGASHFAAPNLAATAWAIFAVTATNPLSPVEAR